MKISRFALFFVYLTCFWGQMRAEDIIQMVPLHTTAGITSGDACSVDFVLTTNSSTPVWGYQLDILLPEGVQFDDSLSTPFTLKAERNPLSAHHIDYAHLLTGWWRIIVTPNDYTRLTGSEGVVMQARYITANDLTEGLHPILVKRNVIATTGTQGINPMRSASYFAISEGLRTNLRHVELSGATGQLPAFVVDSLCNELAEDSLLTRLDIRSIDSIAKPLGELPNKNALIIAKAGTQHAGVQNTLTVPQLGSPVCQELLLDEESGNLDIPFDFKATRVKLLRTLYKTKWNTLCLPFGLTTDEIHTILGPKTQIATFKGFETENEENYLVFERKDTSSYTIEANFPYLIKTGVTRRDTLLFSNLNLTQPASLEQDVDDFVFVGTYNAYVPIPVDCYYISDNTFYQSAGLSTQRPFRAFFRDDRGAGVKQLSFTFWEPNDEDTGEDEDDYTTTYINLRANSDDSIPIFNLQGQCVAHPCRGICIRNGRKLLIP